MQMEYEQPIHIEHETESTDEETENPTEDSFRIDTGWNPAAGFEANSEIIGNFRIFEILLGDRVSQK